MSTIAVSGSRSGIGAATLALLRERGHRTLGIDIADADITADLSLPEGRASAVAAVLERCDGTLDGLVLCAGLGPVAKPHSKIVAVNYFGAVALLDGLRAALQRGASPAAVVVSSISSVQTPWEQNPIARALEAGDEAQAVAALAAAGEHAGQVAYAGSKNALTVAVRRRAAEWGQAGVRLNTVAPGIVETPLLQAGLADPLYGPAISQFTAPLGRRARPAEIAATIEFLLGPGASYVHGAQLFVDGGVDAASRPTQF
ncbi:MAG TPA: SDR family oxidoreductase [Steroidobacter sp.]|jgi:NAD(P)-dependent dehydrogenase (short-subunit alcohol dehydrogenase family)|nr:SDR family oxidoreductase [Steroidobacteraceae bacterium]HLS79932.1 SDR family oxidoreductase [Steroidobacter sp.]